MSGPFALDARLAGDSLPVVDLPLCSVRLMNDARFPWLLLVPRRAGASEVDDLAEIDQARLWKEAGAAGRALRAIAPCDKLNIAALGNVVRQLHVHIVARRVGDGAWPNPVWGSGPALPYAQETANAMRDALAALLTPGPATATGEAAGRRPVDQ